MGNWKGMNLVREGNPAREEFVGSESPCILWWNGR